MAFMLINRLTATTGRRDEVVRNLIDAGKRFDDNAACLLYLVAESTDADDAIWVIDLWTSETDHAAALQDPELQPSIAATTPLLTGMPQQIRVNARGGKGVPDG
ncbi:MAG TPA: antibiotic biosynthesis monooxygenase [Actinomycetota bacterium]|nr:antibiotic biosynthesis monooxygenase [Actinomycetota bacterium]